MPGQNTIGVPVTLIATGDDGIIAKGQQVSANGTSSIIDVTNGLQDQITTLANSSFNSGRAFARFNTDQVIDDTNLATFNDRNNLYTAQVNKVTDVFAPSDADIAAAGASYPVVMEFTHLAGEGRPPGSNLLRLVIADGNASLISDSIALLQREDVVIIEKSAVGADWTVSRSNLDPSATLLPSGVFDLQTDVIVSDITNIETELGSTVISAGEAYLVETGGTWFNVDIGNRAVIVALTGTPSLASNSIDWLVIENGSGSITNDHAMFLNQVARDGNRFDLSRNVFVNESNVISFNAMASGTGPSTAFAYFTSNNGGPTARTVTFSDQAIQFTDLVGGTLRLAVSFLTIQSSGFLPELTSLTFTWGAVSFVFPLTGANVDGGVMSVDITIPNVDYSAILNTNCNITLDYQFRGANYIGSVALMGLINILDGSLRSAVTSIADNSAALAEARVNDNIDRIAGQVDNEGSALQAIQPRISPYKTITISELDLFARFDDTTAVAPFPTDIANLNEVSAENPRFTGSGIALFVAVIAQGSHALSDITASVIIPLDTSQPNVDLGESLSFEGNTYFVYRVTGLNIGNVYEIEKVTRQQVVAWPDDISNLQDDVQRIDAELAHAALNLPDAVVQVLDNELSVTEESTPVESSTGYNNSLGDTNAQTVFRETNPNAPSGGTLASKPISDSTGDRARRKLVYFPEGTAYINQAYLTAFDGTTGRDLIRYAQGVFSAQVRVPAVPQGLQTSTIYPAQSNRVSGAGIWQNVPALTFVNGVPTTEADEIFFTRNLPTAASTLTIQYRGHANGNVFGSSSTTLAGVGGSSDVFTSFILNAGSESATVEVRWYGGSRRLRVSVTERVNAGLPTINDIEVILSFTETRIVPATPETVREVELERVNEHGQVFAIKPSASGSLIIVGDETEIDTGYPYTTLFGASEGGNFIVPVTAATYLDYEDFEPIATTVTDLENHSTLPQLGLFSTSYTRETILDLGVTLRPVGLNVGNLPTSSTGLVSGDLWNNGGALTIV